MGFGRKTELVFELKKIPHLNDWVGVNADSYMSY
jgi:hypothetical protein